MLDRNVVALFPRVDAALLMVTVSEMNSSDRSECWVLGATRDTAPRGRRDTSSSPRARTSPCSSSAGRGQFNCVGCTVYSVLCTVYSVGIEKFQFSELLWYFSNEDNENWENWLISSLAGLVVLSLTLLLVLGHIVHLAHMLESLNNCSRASPCRQDGNSCGTSGDTSSHSWAHRKWLHLDSLYGHKDMSEDDCKKWLEKKPHT